MNFVKKYDLKKAVEEAPPKVREMFQKRTLALDGDASVAKNTKLFLNWFIFEFYGAFEKEIGFSEDTFEQKLAPGKGMFIVP